METKNTRMPKTIQQLRADRDRNSPPKKIPGSAMICCGPDATGHYKLKSISRGTADDPLCKVPSAAMLMDHLTELVDKHGPWLHADAATRLNREQPPGRKRPLKTVSRSG